ncbi:pilus assembly FimT family protein [Pseudaquabacterium rugosum]|uniref:Prepilin-type N-terminal cleavage/methylation domain-containing protein n=1 Tax=Pseudaquabacterium rugosum TaxID=2984194 RepID=A0ABU9BD70_9BURK
MPRTPTSRIQVQADRREGRPRGLTLIELLLVVALFGVLAAVSAPSIATYLARKRVDGTAQEFATTVRYARALQLQSPQRALRVFLGISSGTGFSCAGVYMANDHSTCDCGRATNLCNTIALFTVQPEMLRMIRLPTADGVSIANAGTDSFLRFDELTALPYPIGANSIMMSSIISSSRGGSLRVDIGPTGMPVICEIRTTGQPVLHPTYGACT